MDWSKTIAVAIAVSIAAAFSVLSPVAMAQANASRIGYEFCGQSLSANAFQRPVDYNDPFDAEHVAGIEFNHLNRDVETLVRGQTSDSPIDDLAYILRQIPNHHRALAAMANFQVLNGYWQEYESRSIYKADCYFRRALNFNPNDSTVHMIYGIFLHKSGNHEAALTEYLIARDNGPPDAQTHYNLGLLYVDLKQYDSAREEAKRAYELGYPLIGLKARLDRAGEWTDE